MGYIIHTLDEKTWLIEEEAKYNVYQYLLTGDTRAVLLDTGYGTIPLADIVKSLTDLPVTVLCTHGHYDHIGGNRQFSHCMMHRADKELYHQHRTMVENGTSEPDLELEWFEGSITLDLGNRKLEVFPVPGHTRGCVAILDTDRRQLFTGDTCCKGAVLLQFDHSADLATYRDSIVSILEKRERFDRIWPAHHAKPLSVEIPEQFLQASQLLLNGEPTLQESSEGKVFHYQNIQIVY